MAETLPVVGALAVLLLAASALVLPLPPPVAGTLLLVALFLGFVLWLLV